MAEKLRTPPAPGLDEQVRKALRDRSKGRWRLHLSQEQMASVANGFWLPSDRVCGTSQPLRRDYGFTYPPAAIVGSRARTNGPAKRLPPSGYGPSGQLVSRCPPRRRPG
ncbi:DUF6417 family protein [Streptomyces sp. NPDC096132]|uniref:DUF6417 family protein n=1 Tax=Streptomyces sp. NPDC096132 TaxID=3366075 RepID=UPI00382A43F0